MEESSTKLYTLQSPASLLKVRQGDLDSAELCLLHPSSVGLLLRRGGEKTKGKDRVVVAPQEPHANRGGQEKG